MSEVSTGGSVADAPAFVVNSAQLGEPVAMTLGTVLLVAEPSVFSH